MRLVHKFLDWQPFPTWVYESALRLSFETGLLVLCAYPSVTSSAALQAQIFSGAIRLIQVEVARKKASILGRAQEQGKIPARPKLADEKEHELYVLGWLDDLSTYVFAIVAPIVAAILGGGELGLTIGLTIFATFARLVYDRALYPAWRQDRVAWKAELLTA